MKTALVFCGVIISALTLEASPSEKHFPYGPDASGTSQTPLRVNPFVLSEGSKRRDRKMRSVQKKCEAQNDFDEVILNPL